MSAAGSNPNRISEGRPSADVQKRIRDRLAQAEYDRKKPIEIPWKGILIGVAALAVIAAAVLAVNFIIEARNQKKVEKLSESAVDAAAGASYLRLSQIFKEINEFIRENPDYEKQLTGAKALTASFLLGEYGSKDPEVKKGLGSFGQPGFQVLTFPKEDVLTPLSAAYAYYYLDNLGASSYYASLLPEKGVYSPLANSVKAALLIAQEETEAAKQTLSALTADFPGAVVPGVFLARAYDKIGDKQAAYKTILSISQKVGPHELLDKLLLYYRSYFEPLPDEDTDKLKKEADSEQVPPRLKAYGAIASAASHLQNKRCREALNALQTQYPKGVAGSARYYFLLAKAQVLYGEPYERAEANFIKAQELDAGSIAASEGLIDLYEKWGRPKELAAVYENLKDAEKMSAALLPAVGRAYMALRNFEEAAVLFKKAMFADKENKKNEEMYAKCLIHSGAFSDAERFIKQLKDMNPSKAFPFILEAELFSEQKKTDKAQAALKQAETVEPDNPDVFLKMLSLTRRDDNPKAYYSYLEKLHKAKPEFGEASVLFADYLLAKNNADKIAALAAGVQNENFCYSIRARMRAYIGDFLSDKQPKINPFAGLFKGVDVDCSGLKEASEALSLAMDKNRDAAMSLIREALNKGANSYDAHLLAGIAYERANENSFAVGAYETSLNLNPAQPWLLLKLGKIAFDNKQYAEALLRFEKALKWYDYANNGPKRAETLYYVGQIHIIRNDQAKAKASFEKAMKLDPKATRPLVALARYFYKGSSSATAEKLLNKALELSPDDPEAVFELGDVYRLWGKMRQAKKRFEHYLRIAPNGKDAELCRQLLETSQWTNDDEE